MKKKRYIKSYRSKSSLTGEILKSGFYVLSSSSFGNISGIGYCKGPEHNYEMDFQRSESLFVSIQNCFVPECNAPSHDERVKLLEKNAFLNFATRGVPLINENREGENLKSHIRFFDKNESLIFFGRKAMSKKKSTRGANIKYNGVKLGPLYSFYHDKEWRNVKYKNDFLFIEENIFNHFTSEFDSLFKIKNPVDEQDEGHNLELCVENICTYLGVNYRKNQSNCDRLRKLYTLYTRENNLVSFFKSKMADHGITISRNKKKINEIEKTYKYEKDFNLYLKSKSLV